jgi:hypothetical protein
MARRNARLFSRGALYLYSIPAEARDRRCSLDADTCIVDDEYYCARGCLEIPVHGETEPFVWGVWVSLSQSSFAMFRSSLDRPARANLGSFFGWLSADLPLYPRTENLKTRLHLRDGIRPYIELEPTDHPLAVEQRSGMLVDRVAEIYAYSARGQGRRLSGVVDVRDARTNENAASVSGSGVSYSNIERGDFLSLAGLAATYSPRA